MHFCQPQLARNLFTELSVAVGAAVPVDYWAELWAELLQRKMGSQPTVKFTIIRAIILAVTADGGRWLEKKRPFPL